jgi:O-methyltransferase
MSFDHLYEKYQAETMIPRAPFVANLQLMLERAPHGAFVECGTWRGGMSAAMVEIGGDREYWFFDSFQGLPPAEGPDGSVAVAWQSRKDAPNYYNNCTASQDEFKATLDKTGASSEKIHVVPGWFDQTFPSVVDAFDIAVLRLDADWHRSTALCLAKFWPWVVKNGIVIIDDYNVWAGCRRATDRFFGPANIRNYRGVSYVIREN